MTKHAWALALPLGPTIAYLTWAIQRKRPAHAAAAIILSLLLWVGGPIFISYVGSTIT